jgi:hypothetical protein
MDRDDEGLIENSNSRKQAGTSNFWARCSVVCNAFTRQLFL